MSVIYGNTNPAAFAPANNVPVQVNTDGTVVTTDECSYRNITANATNTLKSGAGILHTLVVGAVGSAWTITIYDSLTGSGTIIATITPAAGCLIFDAAFSTGLTIVTAGTTAGNITVTYK